MSLPLIVSVSDDVKLSPIFTSVGGCGNNQYRALFSDNNSNEPPATFFGWCLFLDAKGENMKKFLLFITAIFICGAAIAQTIRWHIGDTVYQTTTCNAGESITPPTAPDRFGYTFQEWEVLFTRIEYLESTGTQWIDTGVRPNINTGFNIKFIQNNTTADECPIGSRIGPDNNQMLFFMGATNEVYVNVGISPTRIENPNFTFATLKTAIMHNKIFKLIETDTNQELLNIDFSNVTANQLNYSLPLYIFSANQNNQQNRPFEGKIYYVKIYDNDTLVRDFIPVLDKNGTPCMYDKVENKFYYNAGTGQFIAGPVLNE